MSEKKSNNQTDKKNNKKQKRLSIFRLIVVVVILVGFIAAGAIGGIVMGIIKNTEPIDPTGIYDMLDESSFIYDSEGQLIEKIESNNFRIVVDYADMP